MIPILATVSDNVIMCILVWHASTVLYQWVHHLVAEFVECDVCNIAPTNQWSSCYSLPMRNQGATKHHPQSTYTGVILRGRGVSSFLLIVFLPFFLSCFQKWLMKLFSLRVYSHQRVSQCIISGNNLSITFHECSLHHSFLMFVCSLFFCCCWCVTYQFDDVIILSSQEFVLQIIPSKCKREWIGWTKKV